MKRRAPVNDPGPVVAARLHECRPVLIGEVETTPLGFDLESAFWMCDICGRELSGPMSPGEARE